MRYKPNIKGSALETSIRLSGESWKPFILELPTMHNWNKILDTALQNSRGSNWDKTLFDLIAESYDHPQDDRDRKVLCVLIALHEAIQDKVSLDRLAQASILICRLGEIDGTVDRSESGR